jgi:hypothetical protein
MKTTLFVPIRDSNGLRAAQNGDVFAAFYPDPGETIPIEIDLADYRLAGATRDWSCGRPINVFQVIPKAKEANPTKYEEI